MDDVSAGEARITLEGALCAKRSGALYEELVALTKRKSLPSEVVVDLTGVERLDTAGIATLSLGATMLAERGSRLRLEGHTQAHRDVLGMMPLPDTLPVYEEDEDEALLASEPEQPWWRATWRTMRHVFALVGDVAVAFGRAMVSRAHRPPRGAIGEQMVLIGVNALPIVGLLSLLLGLILAFQSAFQLQQFGANIFVANLVGVSMTREFGAMMTAIILAGRSGSAIAAELATMKVQEELDALRTMGINPTRFLLLPRLIAICVMAPLLTLMADVVGIGGGFIIGTLYMDLSAGAFINQTLIAVTLSDFMHGLLKSVVFGAIIGGVGCWCGMSIEGGASGVGRQTTRAVVASIFLIILADSIFAVALTLSKS